MFFKKSQVNKASKKQGLGGLLPRLRVFGENKDTVRLFINISKIDSHLKPGRTDGEEGGPRKAGGAEAGGGASSPLRLFF